MKHYAPASRRARIGSICQAIVEEIMRPRSWKKWVQMALDTMCLIPALHLPAKIFSLAMKLLNRDYLGFACSVAALACLPGILGKIMKAAGLAQTFWVSACSGASIARRCRSVAV